MRNIRVAMKGRDFLTIQSEFDDLSKAMSKAKKVLALGIPRPLVKILCDLEDYIATQLADRAAFKTLSASQGRALNRMKLTLKKHNKPYEVVMKEYRKNPMEEDEDDEEEDDEKGKVSAEDSSSEEEESGSEEEEVSFVCTNTHYYTCRHWDDNSLFPRERAEFLVSDRFSVVLVKHCVTVKVAVSVASEMHETINRLYQKGLSDHLTCIILFLSFYIFTSHYSCDRLLLL
jgi:hypothetical protein